MELVKYSIAHQQDFTATAALDTQVHGKWTKIFDPYAAIHQMWKEVEKRASSHTTRHTARQYRICLYDFLTYCGAVIILELDADGKQKDKTRVEGDMFDFSQMRLHTPELMNAYIVDYCGRAKERSPKTIKKYLAAIRQYLKALRNQRFIGITGDIRWTIQDVKETIDLAMQVNPPDEITKTSVNLGRRGIWLNKAQLREIMSQFDVSLKKDARDKAILAVAFESALRVSALSNLRLCDIKRGKNCWEVVAMDKRNNVSPKGISDRTYDLILAYVALYNEGLAEDDERRITATSALWQPMRHGDNYETIGVNHYCVERGLGANAIRKMFVVRTPDVLREELGLTADEGVKPHDARRTVINGLIDAGVALKTAQRVAGHSSISTTGQYLDDDVNLATALLGNIWGVW